MSKVRVAVIGAGSWAVSAHLPALAKRSDVEIVAIQRRDLAAAERIRDRFGIGHAFDDYRALLDIGVDACIVSSPTSTHPEHVLAALAAGAHVLCEKPMAVTSVDAWSMVNKSEELGRSLTVAFGWNYSTVVRDAKQYLVNVGIGEIEHVTIEMSSFTRELLLGTGSYPGADLDTVPDSRTWVDPALSGGGYAQAQLSHALGLALHLMDTRVIGAFALFDRPVSSGVELHASTVLTFANGATGVMTGSSTHVGASKNRHLLRVRLVGDEGQFELDLLNDRAWGYRRDTGDVTIHVADGAGMYNGELPADALVDITHGKLENTDSPGELGAVTVEALELVYQSARSGTFAGNPT